MSTCRVHTYVLGYFEEETKFINLILLTINAACHPYSTDICHLCEYTS